MNKSAEDTCYAPDLKKLVT